MKILVYGEAGAGNLEFAKRLFERLDIDMKQANKICALYDNNQAKTEDWLQALIELPKIGEVAKQLVESLAQINESYAYLQYPKRKNLKPFQPANKYHK